jgi:hypothetical protein
MRAKWGSIPQRAVVAFLVDLLVIVYLNWLEGVEISIV